MSEIADPRKFHTHGLCVYRQEGGNDDLVCEASDFIEGAAEQIANALNRLPAAEQLLLTVAGAIRNGEATRLHKLADEIEEWMVNG